MLIGAHVSIGGGIDQAVVRANRLKSETFQIFARSPRTLRAKPLEPEKADLFKMRMAKSNLSKPMIHDNYLINLGTPKARMQKLYRKAFADEMSRAQVLGVPYLVFHPGAHMGKGEKQAIVRIAANLDWCIENTATPDVTLCMENTAGQGTVVGHRFEQMRTIIDSTKYPGKMAVCLDTCHAFASGYDLRTREGYEAVLTSFHETVGIDRLKAFHLNDSVGELGSHLDRHQHIGKGLLGTEVFRLLMNDPRFKDCPGNIETPDFNGWNGKNLKLLRSLRV